MSKRQRKERRKRRRRQGAPRKGRAALGASLTIGATLAAGGSAQAATFTVNDLADPGGTTTGCDTTECTLREAINAANANSNNTLGENDGILFDSALSGTIDLDSDLPTITDGVYIEGPGSSAVTVDGGDTYPIFVVSISTSYDQDLSISDLTLANGSRANDGGAVANIDAELDLFDLVITSSQAGDGGAAFNGNLGELFVDESVVSGNVAAGHGGAFYNSGGYLEVNQSLVTDNHADEGGAIYSLIGDVEVDESTLSGNEGTYSGGGVQTYAAYTDIRHSTLVGNYTDGDGGGIKVWAWELFSIEESTISGNEAGGRGGGIDDSQYETASQYYRVDLSDSTVAGNYATVSGGGIAEDTDDTYPVFVGNTIVADNTVGSGGSDPDLSGTFTVSGLVEDPSGASITGSPLTGDPQLQPLAYNGGLTPTHAPLVTSPAIDSGGSTALFDQRGLTRLVDLPTIPNTGNAGQGVDIGAVELQSLTDSQPVPPGPGGGPGGAAGATAPRCKGKAATIFARPGLARNLTGTNKKDVIVGTSKKDKINARGGNDTVCAKGGKDTVKGGGGKDKLYGQGGKDTLLGQGGKDTLSGGGGNDSCVGGAGKDTEKSC
jgi:CSLREA domain-containing protein